MDRDSEGKFPLKCIRKEVLTHDTYRYDLEFPKSDWISGLYAGGAFIFHAEGIDSRKYTPISQVNEKGKAIFIIKIYRKHPDYPGKGLMTQYLEDQIQVGDNVICSGPSGKVQYHGYGNIGYNGRQLGLQKLGLIAGGTGITPGYCIALASSLMKDGFQIRLLFCNKTKDDILCDNEVKNL